MTTASAEYLRGEPRIVLARYPVSWGPILMGALVATGIQFIFTVLGIAIGVSSTDTSTNVSSETISTAAAAWWLITGTIALFIGGVVFGRMSGMASAWPLWLEAVVMWAAVALFGFFVLWSGVGMAAGADSPLTSITHTSRAAINGLAPATAINGVAPDGTFGDSVASLESARQTVRTASWWALVGLIAGVAASIAGACLAARNEPRDVRGTDPALV